MAVDMKRFADKAREKLEQEEREKQRKELLAQGKGPIQTGEEALAALQEQRERQKVTKPTTIAAKPAEVKPAETKPTDAKGLVDYYTRNSESGKKAAWEKSRKEYTSAEKELNKWQEERKRLGIPEQAYNALSAGQELTDEQRSVLSIWGDGEADRADVAAQIAEADAKIAELQGVMDANHDSFVNGYGSIQNERAERYKGTQGDAVAKAGEMIKAGQMGEWSKLWQNSMGEKTAQRDELAADIDVLKQNGAAKDVIREAEERLSWLEEDIQALTDVSVLAEPDFAKHAAFDQTVTDPIYRYVNGMAPEQTWSSEANAQNQNLYALYSLADDTDKNVFNYKYKKYGRKEAMRYLESIGNKLKYKQSMQTEEESRRLAQDMPGVATGMAVLMSPLQAAGAVDIGMAALTGNQANPYSAAFAPVRMRENVMGTVQENIESPLGKGLYQVGTSIADNLVNMGIGGGFGKAASIIAGGLMGMEAAAGKGMQMLEAGADTGTAALGGGIAGAAELVTEKLGFDNLVSKFFAGKMKGTYKDILKAVVASFGSGGAEETTSAIADETVDRWLMGENSQRTQMIREGVESGKTVDEAIRDADWQFVKSLGETFVVGGAAEGLMGGGSYALGVTNARKATQEIKAELPGVDENLVQQAMEMEAGVRTKDEAVLQEAYAQIEMEQEKQNEQQNHAVFEAPAVVNGVEGVVSGVQKSGEGAQVLVKQGGKETAVPLDDVQFQNEEQKQAYGYAAAFGEENTARQFLAGYEKSNAPLSNYVKGFTAAYTAGRGNRELIGTEKVWAKAVPDAIREMAYAAGQRSVAEENTRLDMAENVEQGIRKNIQAMPRMATEEYTGAVNQVRRTQLSASQATQMAMLDTLGKKYGTQYIFVDSFAEAQSANKYLGVNAASVQSGRINGVYRTGTNQMVIAMDAEGGNLLRAAGHESWHYIKEHSRKNDYVRGDADALQAFVLEKLQAAEGYDLETRIAQKQEQYQRLAGQELNREDALEEIVADSLVEVLATEENVRDLMERNATVGEKVFGFIKRFLNDIRTALKNLGGKNAEARAMLEQDEKTLRQIAEHFDRVMIEVNAVRESEGAADGDGGVKYAFMDNIGRPYEEQWREYKNGKSKRDRGLVLNAYEPAIADGAEYWTLPTRVITKGQRTDNQTSRSAHALGDHVFADMENDLNDSDFVVIDRTEGTVAAMKNKSGQVIMYAGKHVEREGYSTIEATTVHERNDPRPMLRSKIESGNDIELYFRKKGKLHKMTGGTIPLYAVSTMERVLNLSQERETVKNKLSLSDAEAAPQTNTAAFKRWFGNSVVVNEDGSPKVMYHGTPYGDFTVFKGWQYFTDDKSYADRYHNPGVSSIRGRYPEATQKKTYAVYLSVKKPFDTRLPEVREIWENEFFGSYSRTPLSEKGLPDWTDGIDLVEFIEENEYDFDGIILDEGATGGYGDEVQSRGVSVVVKESSQIKSATDNVGTYDPKNPDIRYSVSESDEIYEQYRAVSQKLNEAREKKMAAKSAMNNSGELDEVYALMDKDPEAGAKAYKELLEKYDLNNLRMDELQKEANALYSRWEEARAIELEEEERREVEKSGKTLAEYHRDKAVKEFGYTPYFYDAGYIVPNGKMLNFSGEKGRHYGSRGQDHRAIGTVFVNKEGSDAMVAFMHEGNIRIMPESPGIDIASGVEPTTQQYATIRRFVREYMEDEYLNIDFTGENGYVVANLEYEGKIYVDRVVNDIKNYYATGEIREQGISQYRYSLKDVDATNATMETLLEENRALRDTVRALNQQLKGEGGTLDEKAVRRVASGLKKQYASTVPMDTLAENLTRAFTAMQNATDTRQSEAAMAMMGNIALDMVQKSQTADRETYDATRDLRERFRKSRIGLSEMQWQEAKSLFGTTMDFRRAVFGKWNVPAENGYSMARLDKIWDELVEEYPQYFKADASEGDMVQQVLDMLDKTAIKYENPFGAEIEQVASGVATEIYQEYLGVKQKNAPKDPAVDALMDQLADAKRTILEQKRGLRKAARAVADMQAKGERQALRRKQNQDYNQVKNEIIRKKGQLLKKLEAPKSGAFIPASMHSAVHELLKAIDFEGKLAGETNKPLTREMMDRARDEYKKLNLPDENGGTGPLAAFYNGDLEHDFNLLAVEADGLRAKELSMKHMQSLRNIVAGYAAAIINEDRLFMQHRRESLQETGDDLLSSMSMRKEHTVQGPVREWFAKGLQQGLMKPVTAFHQFKGTAMEPVWKALRKAEGQHIRHVEESTNYLEEALGKYDQHESIREEGTKKKRENAKEIIFEYGQKVKLTDQELMTLYATARREQMVGTQHLTHGGFTLANAEKGSSLRPVILTAKDIQTINGSLTKQQKEYVDHMVAYLSGTCADWGNEVTLELYGVEKFHEEYYIPFSVNKNYVKVEPATEQDSRIKTGSFTKALTANASNPLEIKPFTEIWCQHVEKMSDYNAFVLPIEDMTRLMNYKNEADGVKASMNRAYGRQTTDYIMSFLRRLNGNSRNEMGESWLGGFMGRAKGAAVTFNLSVAIQQMGSAGRAMSMIDPRYFAKGTVRAALHGKQDGHRSFNASYAELEKHAPIAVEKGWGYFDTNMSRGMYQRARNTTMDRLNDAGGKLAEMGDKMTWARIWEAVKAETTDTYKEVMVGSDEFYELCADRFTDVIDNTQVVDSIFQRAEWAAEKGMMKNFMAFMSEPLTTYNMVYRSIWDLSNAKSKAAKAMACKRVGRTVASIVVSSAMTAALKSFVTALRDRDNEKKDEEGNIVGVRGYWDKYADAIPGAFQDNILGVGTIFTNAISDALSGFGGSSDLTTGWIGNLITGAKYMGQIISGEKEPTYENWEKAMYKMLQGSSSVIGLGFGNLWRDVKSTGMTIYEYVERDMLAGAAWDKNLPFEQRLEATTANYVYSKDGKKPGDQRKVKSEIYYDLMLTAYFEEGGMQEKYEAAADAAIANGATYRGLLTAFKKRLREAEDKIPLAAAALVEGDMETYQRCVDDLLDAGIGLRPISSMILGEVKELEPEEEGEEGDGKMLISEMQREDVDEDPAKYVLNKAYNEATTPQELKSAVDKLREYGTSDKDLRTKVTTSYRKKYCNAVWNGDVKTSKEVAAMMKGAGVGITDDDLADWTGGSYAKDTLYDLIRQGSGKEAVKVRAAMYKASGQEQVNKTIENWVKRYVKGTADEEAARGALLTLGYSKATIDGWFAK